MSKRKNEEPIMADEMLGKSEAFVIKYKKPISIAITVLVAGVLCYILYQKFYVEPRELEAKQESFEPTYDALNGKNIEALEGFRHVAYDYDGTEAGNVAKIMAAGLAAAEEGNYEEAIQLLEAYEGDDDIIAPRVKHALGNCYAHTGDIEKAKELIEEAAEEANNEAVTPACWRDLAAMYEQEGNTEEAVKLYNRIKTEYPNSTFVIYGEIDSHLNSIK
jgi:tetratricopeptide (TPR) repeat protein